MRRIAGMALFGVLAAGCGNDATGPTTSQYEAAREQKLSAGGTVASTPARKPPPQAAQGAPAEPIAPENGETGFGGVEQGYVYDPTGKRDPFRSFVLEEAARRNQGERGPLEQFDLAQIALQGIVWGTEKPRALVADPQGRGYIVKEGTPIGKSSGQITRIGDNMVVVREIYEDALGGRTEKDIEMRIRQSQGG